MIRQFSRCSGVASRSLGYHTRGTVIVRPSARSTLSVSSVKCTSRTASPGLGSEVLIPRFQKCHSILENQPLDCAELTRSESEIAREGHRLKPELGRRFVSVNMDVSWFTQIMTDEVYSVGSAEQNRRHLNSLSEGRLTFIRLPSHGSEPDERCCLIPLRFSSWNVRNSFYARELKTRECPL